MVPLMFPWVRGTIFVEYFRAVGASPAPRNRPIVILNRGHRRCYRVLVGLLSVPPEAGKQLALARYLVRCPGLERNPMNR